MPAPGYIGKAAGQQRQVVGSMAKGGKVPKTGLYQLHAGEIVVPANVVDRTPGAPPKERKMPKLPKLPDAAEPERNFLGGPGGRPKK